MVKLGLTSVTSVTTTGNQESITAGKMETEIYQSVYVKCSACKASIPKIAGGIVKCPACGVRLVFRKGIPKRL